VVESIWPCIVVPLTMGRPVFDGGDPLVVAGDVPVTYAEIAHVDHVAPSVHLAGNEVRLVCADVTLEHELVERSRKAI
jgi:hypothetical protein